MKKKQILSMSVLFLIKLFCLTTVCGQDQYTNYSYESYTSSTHNVTLPYRLFVPEGYDSNIEYPVVFQMVQWEIYGLYQNKRTYDHVVSGTST